MRRGTVSHSRAKIGPSDPHWMTEPTSCPSIPQPPPPNGPALPGNEAFGIQLSFEGRFAVCVGGFPIVVDGEVIGGVGLSGRGLAWT